MSRIAALVRMGRQTRAASLWFYGDNESYFPRAVWYPISLPEVDTFLKELGLPFALQP